MAVANELVKPFFNAPDALLQPVSVGGGAAPVPAWLRKGEVHGYVRLRDDRATCPLVPRPTSALLLIALDSIKARVRHDRAST